MLNGRNVKSDNFEATNSHEIEKDFLSEAQLEKLFEAAKKSRHGLRDHLLFLMMYRHGLCVSEALSIKIVDIYIKSSRLWVSRSKNGLSVEQPMAGDELRLIKLYFTIHKSNLLWLFLSEQTTND